MMLSVVIPVFNECPNIRSLYLELREILLRTGHSYEIVFVDDGSSDGSQDELCRLAEEDRRIRVIEFRRNFGQTAAMDAGIRAAVGDVIVTMDADLQNDPADIPMMLDKLDEGYDLVHGWRKQRQDPFLNRRLPSRVANWIISRATGFPVRDLGCTLKVIRREIAQELELYGEMHRFIPILAHWHGARCIEVVTNHRSRKHGVSKYGISRSIRVLLDLVTVKYLVRYLVSPMKLFGGIGLGCGLVGLVSAGATIWMKLMQQIDMTGNPLLLLSVFSVMAGIQFLMLGMLGELGGRIYYEVRKARPYTVRRSTNLPGTIDEPVEMISSFVTKVQQESEGVGFCKPMQPASP